MRDAGRLQIRDRLSIHRGPHRVAHRLQREGVPVLRVELHRESNAAPAGWRRRLAGRARGTRHREALLVREDDRLRRDARHAEVPVVRTVERPVVKLRRDRLRAPEPEPELDHAVLRRDVVAYHRLMPLHRRLRFHIPRGLHRRSIEPHLRPLQRALLDGKSRHHDLPSTPQLRLLEVIRKKQLLLLRNRLLGNRRKLRRIRGEGGGGDEAGEGEEVGVHRECGLDRAFPYTCCMNGDKLTASKTLNLRELFRLVCLHFFLIRLDDEVMLREKRKSLGLHPVMEMSIFADR